MWRRVVAGILGAVAILDAVVAFGYASRFVDSFNKPTALVANDLMSPVTLGAFAMGIHFMKYCATGRFIRLNRWARASLLGALFIFLGLIVLFIRDALRLSKGWPSHIYSDNVAMLSTIFIGAVLAVIVCVTLIRAGHETMPPSVTADKSPYHSLR